MTNLPKVYVAGEDQLVDVTQDWCDDIQKAINRLARKQDVVRAVMDLNSQTQYHILDKIIEAIREG